MARRILAAVLVAIPAGQVSDVAGFVAIDATFQVGGDSRATSGHLVGAGAAVGEVG